MTRSEGVLEIYADPLQLFHHQVEWALGAGFHLAFYKSPDEFREWLFPLSRALPAEATKCHVSALLVLPHTALPSKRRMSLVEQLSHPQRKVSYTDDVPNYIGKFKDVGKIPKEPYLALSVVDGREHIGSLEFEEGFRDRAARSLKRLKRYGLTLDEGLWLWCSMGEELRFVNARLLSTRMGESWADIEAEKDSLVVDDYTEDGAEHVWKFRVPSCAARIGLSEAAATTQ